MYQLKQTIQQQQSLIDQLKSSHRDSTGTHGHEIYALKQKLSQQQAFIDTLQAQLKNSNRASAFVCFTTHWLLFELFLLF